MKNFKDLLSELKKLEITQENGSWEESIPFDLWDEFFKDNHKVVSKGLDVDTRRWYETSITVIELCGGFLGIRHITNMFSESQDYDDCCVTIQFMEMKQINVVSYAPF